MVSLFTIVEINIVLYHVIVYLCA